MILQVSSRVKHNLQEICKKVFLDSEALLCSNYIMDVSKKGRIGQKIKMTPQEFASGTRAKYVSNFQEKIWKNRMYENGSAFRNHKKACHWGAFDPVCPACQKLQKSLDSGTPL
jgi:hypothetical protein